MKKTVQINIPKWAAIMYVVIAIILIPWTIYLGFHLPVEHITINWDTLWVGLDLAIVITLLASGILAYKKSIYTILFASMNGMLFITDAWFDVFSYRVNSLGSAEAIVMAIFGEIPMAIFSFSLAVHVLKKLHSKTV